MQRVRKEFDFYPMLIDRILLNAPPPPDILGKGTGLRIGTLAVLAIYAHTYIHDRIIKR